MSLVLLFLLILKAWYEERPHYVHHSFFDFIASKRDLAAAVVVWFVLTILLLLLTNFARRVLAESHLGWKRLVIVASVVAAVVTGIWYLSTADSRHYYHGTGLTVDDYAKSALYGLAALIIVAFSLIYGRMVIMWVVTGFKDEAKQKLSQVQRPNSAKG